MADITHENHGLDRIGWLRAAVLGANDGIISTASLIVGVATAASAPHEIFVAGAAGLVAGATAMAAGEYVSVSSQSDSETAALAQERQEQIGQPAAELDELAQIYVARGVEPALARQVAKQMMAKDAFGSHVRDELGLTPNVVARPIQAAVASAAAFSTGAALPLAIALVVPTASIIIAVSTGSLVGLAALGALGASVGGAPLFKPTVRVTFWGAVALAATAAIGHLVGRAV